MRFLSTLAASVLGTLIAVVALFVFLFLFVLAIGLSAETTPMVQSGSILTVDISGPIPERVSDDPLTRSLENQGDYDLLKLTGALRKAESDDRIEGVWLRLEGTSASWATLEHVRSALQSVRDRGKPIIASSGDFGMSEKDYFLATAADSIFSGPVTPFEFNGLYFPQTFFKGTLEKLGVEAEVVRAGQYKSAIEQFTRDDLSENNELQLQALVDTRYEVFLNAVSEAREMTVDELRTIATTNAPQGVESAMELGLIDDLRYTDQVVDVFRGILGSDPGASVPTIDVGQYARVPASEAGVQSTGTGQVAVIYGTGQIVPGDPSEGPFNTASGFLGSDPIVEAFREARENDRVKSIVFRVDSPGGSAAASEAIWREVRRTVQEKPVIVSMGALAASGGYYIAAPADTIVASPNTITGSIGVFGLKFNVEGLFQERLGISIDDVRTSDLADINSPFSSFSERERQLLSQQTDRTYQTFLERVSEGRNMAVDAVDEVAQGRVWSGQDALDQGLVDVLGGLADAIRIAGEAGGLGVEPRVQILPRKKTFFQQLNEDLSGATARAYWHASTSDVEKMLQAKRDVLKYYLRQSGTVQARMPYSFEIR